MICPCQECNDRYRACHGSCERYHEWHSQRQQMLRERSRGFEATNFLVKQIQKTTKRNKIKWR